jgi:hypothetical protein
MLVIALHTAYLAAWLFRLGHTPNRCWIALAAYASLRDQRSAVPAEAAHGATGGDRDARTPARGAGRDVTE